MKGFACDEMGDLLMQSGEIRFVEGEELLCQKARAILASGQGEWWLDETEGMDRRVLLGKKPDAVRLRDEIGRALLALGEDLTVTDFAMEQEGRCLTARFSAETAGGKKLAVMVKA